MSSCVRSELAACARVCVYVYVWLFSFPFFSVLVDFLTCCFYFVNDACAREVMYLICLCNECWEEADVLHVLHVQQQRTKDVETPTFGSFIHFSCCS